LIIVFQAQAKECVLEKLELDTPEERGFEVSLELCQEASHVADCYRTLMKFSSAIKEYIPYTWSALMSVKMEFYSALAHRHIALGLLDVTLSKVIIFLFYGHRD